MGPLSPHRKIHRNVLKKKKKSGILPASSRFPGFCIVTAGTDGVWARLRTPPAWPRKAWCSPGMLPAAGLSPAPPHSREGSQARVTRSRIRPARLILSGPNLFSSSDSFLTGTLSQRGPRRRGWQPPAGQTPAGMRASRSRCPGHRVASVEEGVQHRKGQKSTFPKAPQCVFPANAGGGGGSPAVCCECKLRSGSNATQRSLCGSAKTNE